MPPSAPQPTSMPPPGPDQADRLERIAAALEGPPPRMRALVGFDGFLDQMIRVVDERVGADDWRPVEQIADFGEIIAAAAGRGLGREIVVERVIPGGNGPNLAGGLIALGAEVDLYGALGSPLDPLFEPLSRSCRRCVGIASPGRTLALEFNDGKLMFNETSGLRAVTPALLEGLVEEGLGQSLLEADLIGLVNWSRFPDMTACWSVLRDRIMASAEGAWQRRRSRPLILIDPADPSSRTAADIRAMIRTAASMTPFAQVLLSVNACEAEVIAAALGLGAVPGAVDPSETRLGQIAQQLRAAADFDAVVVHAHHAAACAWREGHVATPSAFTPSPRVSTGVGDRFNAALCWAIHKGLDYGDALLLGCAAGGCFVREARPATPTDLAGFCRTWAAGHV